MTSIECLFQPLIEYCLEKKGAYIDHPFGPDSTIIKVRGKIFAQFFTLRGEAKTTLKCDPGLAELLRGEYPGAIVRGYHCPPVQQPYWNTVSLGGSVPERRIYDMIDHAYEVVVLKLPKKVQKELLTEQ